MNLTPLLDVIFNLIFFFIVATTIRSEESFFDLSLPEVSEAQSRDVPLELPEIFVSEDGSVALDGESISLEDLTLRLQERVTSEQIESVVLSADAKATVQNQTDAMAAIQKAGIYQVNQKLSVEE